MDAWLGQKRSINPDPRQIMESCDEHPPEDSTSSKHVTQSSEDDLSPAQATNLPEGDTRQAFPHVNIIADSGSSEDGSDCKQLEGDSEGPATKLTPRRSGSLSQAHQGRCMNSSSEPTSLNPLQHSKGVHYSDKDFERMGKKRKTVYGDSSEGVTKDILVEVKAVRQAQHAVNQALRADNFEILSIRREKVRNRSTNQAAQTAALNHIGDILASYFGHMGGGGA